MATLTWEPRFREALNRMFEDAVYPAVQAGNGQALRMPIDILETADELLVEAEFPGAAKENFEISCHNSILSIKADLSQTQRGEGTRHLLKERAYGSVTRSFRLPFPVDLERARAEYKDGVLTLTLPKQEAAKPRSIQIN